MKIVRAILIATLFTFTLSGFALADTAPTLTLDPVGGAITGVAGSTVGWGFTLTNLGSDFAVITGSDFCVGPITSPCSNPLGTYTDFVGQQFFVLGPSPESSSLSQSFDLLALTGVGSFFINPLAQPGDKAIGQIVLSYDLFSLSPNDPNFDPIADTLSNGNFLMAPASVTVTKSTVSTPEPGSLFLLATGLAGCLLAKKRST
jgi:PEP-CTERM motif